MYVCMYGFKINIYFFIHICNRLFVNHLLFLADTPPRRKSNPHITGLVVCLSPCPSLALHVCMPAIWLAIRHPVLSRFELMVVSALSA